MAGCSDKLATERLQDALQPDGIQKLEGQGCHRLEMQDTEPNTPTDVLFPGEVSGPSRFQAFQACTPNTTCATLTLVIGTHQVSESLELSEVNEYPEALKAITPNRPLNTLDFIGSVVPVVIVRLQSTLMTQVVAGMAHVTLCVVASTLQAEIAIAQEHGGFEDALRALLKRLRDELKLAVPFFKWQGPRHRYGRVQYLMALLEEAIRSYGVPVSSVIEALETNTITNGVCSAVAQAVFKLEQDPVDVCGKWAAHALLSPGLRKIANTDASPYQDTDDELPSPSTFVPKKPAANIKGFATGTVRYGGEKGSNADNPIWVFDTKKGLKQRHSSYLCSKRPELPSPAKSSHGRGTMPENHSTEHDSKAISRSGKRKITLPEDDGDEIQTTAAKRGKVTS